MTKGSGDIIKRINYGDGVRNCIGLHPMTGRIEDPSPRQRETWAMRFGELHWDSAARALGATYGDAVVVINVEVPDYVGAHRQVEDNFLSAIFEDDDIVLMPDDDEVEHCPECGEIDGYHHRSCTIGGE